MKADTLQLNRADAERFLLALDPHATRWTFQTFDDNQKRNDKKLARVFHGTLDQLWETLKRLNEQGASINVTVNETDFGGRETANIIRVRTVFTDLDGAPLEPVMRNGREPHIITETSPKKWHTYWRVDDLPLNQFEGVQKALAAKFDGDSSVHDLPRVMRLPGFLHCKGEPFLTRIVSTNDIPAYKAIHFQFANEHEQDDQPRADWRDLVANIHAGHKLHDSIRDLASKLVASGMSGGATVNLLRAVMQECTAPHDARWQARFDDIPNLVSSAQEKFAEPSTATNIAATPFVWSDPSTIPTRRWLYRPYYIRQFTSATISPGGIGKSSKLIVEALAMVSHSALLGIQPLQPLRVWYWNGEDPKEELDRRFAAAMKHYELTPGDINDRLFVDTGRTMPIVIARDTRSDVKIAVPVFDGVIATLRENKIDVLIIDPFISSHRVKENDNDAIDLVAKAWGQIAEVTNCSIQLAHHSRKTGGESVTVEDGRGASSLRDAVRIARVLNNMTVREAIDAEIDERDRELYFRCDIGKRNLTRPAERAYWFKLESVDLENGPHLVNGVRIGSDEIGVVTAWEYPKVDAPVITASDIERVQAAIKAGGPWRADQRAKKEPWVGIPIAQVLGLNLLNKVDKRTVVKLIADWLGAGLLMQVDGHDSHFEARTYVKVGMGPVVDGLREADDA